MFHLYVVNFSPLYIDIADYFRTFRAPQYKHILEYLQRVPKNDGLIKMRYRKTGSDKEMHRLLNYTWEKSNFAAIHNLNFNYDVFGTYSTAGNLLELQGNALPQISILYFVAL